MRRVSCVICHTETDVNTFNRKHERNGRTCILAAPYLRADWTVAYTRYLTGWNLWNADKEERCRASINLEHAKAVAAEKRILASA
jgi:hypothetical protein